ncbi:hypothetical protein OG266_38290 [Streptomyces sp. NBC_00554]|uniref:hypothetical protein n=1 Tax=Streptomyces sp. NBC_00554 TaxID=2903661 RepID=UPI00352FC4FA|nr:hypothetical protein OG266_38290 [Streptomyces sp. NBC_00554]
MGNRADDEGTDVEIHIRALTDTVHADTPTVAPEELLALLDQLGFERKTLTTAGPVYVWHELPDHLSEAAKKRLATSAVPSLIVSGYLVNITDAVWDAAANQEAAEAVRRCRAGHLGRLRGPRPRRCGDTAPAVSHDRKESRS